MKRAIDRVDDLELEPELREAIANFRLNVDAWSEAVAARPRTLTPALRVLSWRLVLGAALGCLLVVGSVTATVAHYRSLEQARLQAAPRPIAVDGRTLVQAAPVVSVNNEQAEAAGRDLVAIEDMLASQANQDSQDESAEGRVTSDDQLLAVVNKDLTRQVPRVMESLARLGEDSAAE
jgi:hypothetical protein